MRNRFADEFNSKWNYCKFNVRQYLMIKFFKIIMTSIERNSLFDYSLEETLFINPEFGFLIPMTSSKLHVSSYGSSNMQ